MMKKLNGILSLCLLLLLALPGTAQDSDNILQTILERGSLNCGINPGLQGFSSQNDAGEWVGFDVDICRAVAAALFGDPNAVTFVPTEADERQLKLEFREIDLLSRNTTATLSRDTDWKVRFAPVTFYDGQGIMVYRESGITNLDILAGGTICVQTDTTSLRNIQDVMAQRGEPLARTDTPLPFRVVAPDGRVINEQPATVVPTTTIQTFNSNAEMMDAFESHLCDAITTDVSGLVARRAASTNPDAITILDLTLSKEPLAPASLDRDPEFANIIMWTVFGLIEAEELGITSDNVAMMAQAPPNDNVKALLGADGATTGDYLDVANDSGNDLDIANNFMVQVISAVGNYAEIYERHLQPLGLSRQLNRLWRDGGLLYAPPFR